VTTQSFVQESVTSAPSSLLGRRFDCWCWESHHIGSSSNEAEWAEGYVSCAGLLQVL